MWLSEEAAKLLKEPFEKLFAPELGLSERPMRLRLTAQVQYEPYRTTHRS